MNILAESIEYLWYSVYGIVAGLGISMVISISIVAFIVIRLFRAEHRIKQLENRLVHAERDYNITLEIGRAHV